MSVAPPLRIDSTVQLAWGLTLNFSHEKTQDDVGKAFMEWLKALRGAYGNDPNAQVYIDNLAAVLGSYLRTSAFERDVFVGYLDIYKNKYEADVKSISDISDLGSVSSSSILVKLAAFLGFGSLAEIIGALTHLASPTQGLPFNLNAVLLGGLMGLALTVLGVKLAKGRLISRFERASYRKRLTFWQEKAKPSFMKGLFFLQQQLKPLVLTFYSSYTEPVLTLPDDQLKKYLRLHPSSEEARAIVMRDPLTQFFDSMLPDTDLYDITKKEPKKKLPKILTWRWWLETLFHF